MTGPPGARATEDPAPEPGPGPEPAPEPGPGPGPGIGVRVAAVLGITVVVLLVDQLTKTWAVDRLSQGPIHVLGPLDLVLAYNTGVSFSLFTGATPLVTAVAVVLVVVLVLLAVRAPSVGRAAIYGLVLGGALGNLADRLFRSHHGAVVDFVDLRVWPTFNVADSAIVVGCLLLAVSLLRSGRPRPGSVPPSGSGGSPGRSTVGAGGAPPGESAGEAPRG